MNTRARVGGVVVAAAILLSALLVTHEAAPKGTGSAATPHVMVVMLENKGYAATLGTCSADPYLCSLGASNASVVGWTGVTHPSEPNYLASTFGSTLGCTSDTCFTPSSSPSLGGQLTTAGVPWTAYMESMPSACYTGQWYGGVGTSALYGEKHDPFVVAADVRNNGCAQHVLPYPGASSLVSTLNGASAPDFVFVVPNQKNDMHSGTVQAGDAWLRANLAPVLSSSWFTGNNSTVIVTMDEHSGDSTGGGGAVPMVVISSNAAGRGNVSMTGNHYGTLRSIEEAYGLPLLGAAGSSAHGDLTSLFGGGVTPTPTPSPTPTPTASPTPTPTGTPGPTPTPTPTPIPTPTPTPTPVPTPTVFVVTCGGTTADTAALQTAINSAEAYPGNRVSISAGLCALSNHLVLAGPNPVAVAGAGQGSTFLIQHAKVNIFQITSPGMTVSDMLLNTAIYGTTYPPVTKSPDPGTLFSDASNTTVRNVTAVAGGGFGLRLTGPNPCYSDLVTGAVVQNVTVINQGTGGFSSIDVDCQQVATISNVVVSGGSITPYQDANVTITNVTYERGPWAMTCEPDIEVTGPTVSVSINNVVTAAGHIRLIDSPSGVTVTNETLAPGNTC